MAALATIVFSSVLSDERTVQLLWTSLCLVAALLVAAVVIACVNRWRRQRDAQEDLSPNAQLAQFRSLYEKGTISQEEFERLRALLAARMRESLGVPTPEKAVDSRIQSEPNRANPPASELPPAPPETGIQKPDGPDTGIHPA
ncbi:MAG TPA: SHOCT domain-containing protein [Gemmataceae bacterium]|nr:SHOCT domain-containing protein [Gemmataceae bacterium]